MPDSLLNRSPRMKFPPPTTTAICTPSRATRAICSAMNRTIGAFKPDFSSPARASPLNFNSTLFRRGLSASEDIGVGARKITLPAVLANAHRFDSGGFRKEPLARSRNPDFDSRRLRRREFLHAAAFRADQMQGFRLFAGPARAGQIPVH